MSNILYTFNGYLLHMSTNDNKTPEAEITVRRRFGGQVPDVLEDEEAELFKRGYSQAQIYAEGIRSYSDQEGIWRRRREYACGTLDAPVVVESRKAASQTG